MSLARDRHPDRHAGEARRISSGLSVVVLLALLGPTASAWTVCACEHPVRTAQVSAVVGATMAARCAPESSEAFASERVGEPGVVAGQVMRVVAPVRAELLRLPPPVMG
jgi:hypothetical protein